MNNEKVRKLKDELLMEEFAQHNLKAVTELMQEWVVNLSENITLMRRCRNLSELTIYGTNSVKGKDRAVVVAAAPELKDEDLAALCDFDGDIICVNKTFKRLVDLGRVPEWVCLLDAHPVSHKQFAWLKAYHWGKEGPIKTKFFVASIVYPPTLKTIMEFTDEVYGFNPIDDSAQGPIRLSKTWEWMNDRHEFEHGGSVGGLAVSLASTMGYKEVGLLGYGLYEKPNPKWTLEEAKERVHHYYPEVNETISIPPHFNAYLMHIMWMVESTKSRIKWVNLSSSPVFRYHPLFNNQADVKEWVK
jgi:hypothetical protein